MDYYGWNRSLVRQAWVHGALVFALAGSASGQERTPSVELDSLIATAWVHSPMLRAARLRVEAARARVRPAGAWSDPTLGVGIMNLPLKGGSADQTMNEGHGTGAGAPEKQGRSRYDDMTMHAVVVGQMVPYPGRLGLQRALASAEAIVEESAAESIRRDIERDVRRAYYDAAYSDRALAVLAQSQKLTIGLTQSAESRYAIGASPQQEVLRLQVESARIAEEAASLSEQRRSALARLNSLLGQVSGRLLADPRIPEPLRAAAVARNPSEIRFVSAQLGARVADSPLPSLQALQDRAIQANPELRAADARLAAQALRVRLAEQAHLPDFDVEFQYGQRPSRPDMVSLMVSVPVPVRRASKQQQELAAVRTELSALQSERAAHILDLNAQVAEVHGELEALRAQLALYVRSILPQGRAAFESAVRGYATGQTAFATLLENRAALFEYELAYERGLASFASKLAELARLVGAEVIS